MILNFIYVIRIHYSIFYIKNDVHNTNCLCTRADKVLKSGAETPCIDAERPCLFLLDINWKENFNKIESNPTH